MEMTDTPDEFIAEALRLGVPLKEGHRHADIPLIRSHPSFFTQILAHAATLRKLAEAELLYGKGWNDAMQAASELENLEIATLTAKLAKAREALEKAHRQFSFYAEEHNTKAKAAEQAHDDACYWSNVAEQEATKAEWQKRTKQAKTNHDFATMLAETLAQIGDAG